MHLNLIDRSNYFKGILILIRKNYPFTPSAESSVKKIASILGFNHNFVDSSIKDLVLNMNITEDPPKFSDYHLAESFIRDGIRITLSDGVINLSQVQWLILTAQKNNLSDQWFFLELEDYIAKCSSNQECNFDIQKHVITHSTMSQFAES